MTEANVVLRADSTMNELLELDRQPLTGEQIESLRKVGATAQLMSMIPLRALPSIWPETASWMLDALEPALDLPVTELLPALWNKAQDIAKYKDREKYPPNQQNVVALDERTIVSTHE